MDTKISEDCAAKKPKSDNLRIKEKTKRCLMKLRDMKWSSARGLVDVLYMLLMYDSFGWSCFVFSGVSYFCVLC